MLYIDFKGYKGDFTNKKMNEQIKSYIEKILGISVQFHHWKGELELPFYITERYDMRLAELDDIRCIFLSPKKKLNRLVRLKSRSGEFRWRNHCRLCLFLIRWIVITEMLLFMHIFPLL